MSTFYKENSFLKNFASLPSSQHYQKRIIKEYITESNSMNLQKILSYKIRYANINKTKNTF